MEFDKIVKKVTGQVTWIKIKFCIWDIGRIKDSTAKKYTLKNKTEFIQQSFDCIVILNCLKHSVKITSVLAAIWACHLPVHVLFPKGKKPIWVTIS